MQDCGDDAIDIPSNMSTPTFNATLAFFAPENDAGLQAVENERRKSSSSGEVPTAVQEQSQPSPPVEAEGNSDANARAPVNPEVVALQAQLVEERKRILEEHRKRVKECKRRGQVLRGRPEKSQLQKELEKKLKELTSAKNENESAPLQRPKRKRMSTISYRDCEASDFEFEDIASSPEPAGPELAYDSDSTVESNATEEPSDLRFGHVCSQEQAEFHAKMLRNIKSFPSWRDFTCYPPHPTRQLKKWPPQPEDLVEHELKPIVFWDPVLFWREQNIGNMPCPWHGYDCTTKRVAWHTQARFHPGRGGHSDGKWIIGAKYVCEARLLAKQQIHELDGNGSDKSGATAPVRRSFMSYDPRSMQHLVARHPWITSSIPFSIMPSTLPHFPTAQHHALQAQAPLTPAATAAAVAAVAGTVTAQPSSDPRAMIQALSAPLAMRSMFQRAIFDYHARVSQQQQQQYLFERLQQMRQQQEGHQQCDDQAHHGEGNDESAGVVATTAAASAVSAATAAAAPDSFAFPSSTSFMGV